jgi:uncharacterized membrane protein
MIKHFELEGILQNSRPQNAIKVWTLSENPSSRRLVSNSDEDHSINPSNHCWNKEVIAQIDLLWVLLSGLVVAFAFTLAFRGVVGIKSCYWGAAIVVHGIVVHLIGKSVPFVAMLL